MKTKILTILVLGLFLTLGVAGVVEATCTCLDGTVEPTGIDRSTCAQLCGGFDKMTFVDTQVMACMCPDGTSMGQITSAECVSRCVGHGTISGSGSAPVSGSGSAPESGSGTSGSASCGENGVLCNPLGSVVSVSDIAGKIIKAIISLLGIISLVMFIYAGFTWLTAGGNATAIKKGKDTMVWAVLGLLVVFSSYILLKFVFTTLGGL